MRSRSLLLFALAIVLAAGTAIFARAWLASQRLQEVAAGFPIVAPKPARSVLVARADLKRGQILRPEEMIWQVWPEGAIDKNYHVLGGPRTPEAFAGWVVKNPVAAGEPVTEAKIVSPDDRGFLAAVLEPGMRAITVPVTVTSGIAGFIFPGDRVDLLLSYPIPAPVPAYASAVKQNYEHRASQTVLRNLRVVGIDQRLEGKPGEAVVAHTATFEVTPKESEIIALATEIGKLSLALRSLAPGADDSAAGATLADPVRASRTDSPVAESTTYTIDSDISPLLPKRGGEQDDSPGGIVTILRGGGKTDEVVKSKPALKGS